MAVMGLAREHDAFELGVGQKAVRHHAFGQHRAPGRHGMRHGGHGGGLHERGRMLDGARDPHHPWPPRIVGAGIGGTGGGGIAGVRPAGLDGKLGHGTPVMGLRRRRRGGRLPRGLGGRDRIAEEVPAGDGRGRWPDGLGLDGEARRHPGDDGIEQLGRRRGAVLAVHRDAGLGAALDDGEARVESGAAPGIGAPVDGHGEDGARGAAHGCEGVAPGGIAGDAVGRGDGGEPAAGRQHREGRADMAQIGVVADAVDPRRRRERRVHQHDRRPDGGQEVGEGLGVVAGDGGAGKQPRKQPGADGRYLVQMQVSGGAAASAHSAITASMPVPAEGSSTVSPGRTAAARSAA